MRSLGQAVARPPVAINAAGRPTLETLRTCFVIVERRGCLGWTSFPARCFVRGRMPAIPAVHPSRQSSFRRTSVNQAQQPLPSLVTAPGPSGHGHLTAR